jgi:hypothetical protein
MTTRYGERSTLPNVTNEGQIPIQFENLPSKNILIIHICNSHNKTIKAIHLASDLSLLLSVMENYLISMELGCI